ncbi:MAG: UDP-N-acetylglucosamine--N-acetylmuramyl-(pentapeptide) pyrophosphoryl-undecaprenol N-acetylglucosamine transferase, partial [Candidatus Omnitrophica bacterium]|nr:UDP-N-acetylglucosamine--N-acetylmuramyl-(pentapeptide) pyrophosphoryl-undecaprenol N-acetylglucosamine transferase [Candidatus Omnitrophota bacterium]
MRIFIACGGTAGHFLPALSFAEALRRKAPDADTWVVLTRRKVEQEADLGGLKVLRLSLVPVSKDLSIKNLAAILKFIFGCLQSLYLVLRFNPDTVIGFGGYASFPVVFFSSLLGKKTFIHEQNVSAGISNKFLALLVSRVAVSFPQSAGSFYCKKNKIVFTGNPIRKDLSRVDRKEALAYFNLPENKFTLLVMGGSQGSRKINTELIRALNALDLEDTLQIVHLSGALDYAQLKEEYGKMKYRVHLSAFLKEMKFAYSAADLAISRSGASSINEIIYYHLPAILVPYPYAAKHQRENAKV